MSYLRVRNVGKAYKRYPGKWARLAEWITGQERHEKHWVLRDISFEVAPGEAVGIIGINGAGKSTLLKIITGTAQPTTGSVEIGGRVAALLELGMGFHPDFTGRQNVYMGGQINGLFTEQISELMPEIESFAEIGDYIDQPLRTYSSGMQVRLAFAVATVVRPDILIVDEALSVGDAAFQRKCFRRIESFLDAGTTLLFVSHDMETVKKICERALFIKEGRLAHWGSAKQVCDEYERYLFGDRNSGNPANHKTDLIPATDVAKFDPSLVASCEMTYGNGKADIEACWLADTSGRRINVIESGTSFRWCYRVRFNGDVTSPIFAMMLKTREGVALYGVDSRQLEVETKTFQAGDTVEVDFTLVNPLAPGVYYLNCGVRLDNPNGVEFLSRRIDSAILRIFSGPTSTAAIGMIELGAKFSLSSTALETAYT